MGTQQPPPRAYWVVAFSVVVLPAMVFLALGKWGTALFSVGFCSVIQAGVAWATPEQHPLQKFVGRRGAGPWPTERHRRQFAALLVFIAVVSTLSIAFELVSDGVTAMLALQIFATVLPLAAGLAILKRLRQ